MSYASSQTPRTVRDDCWHMAVMWYGVEVLPRLRSMSADERMRVMKEAGDWSLREPLWLLGSKYKCTMPSWSEKPISPAHVTALMVFGLWVQVGEDEDMASGLVRDWPEIKTAVFLCPRPESEDRNGDSGRADREVEEGNLARS
jgi:hypothetical protein